MKILFNDVMQKSNAPAALISPALADPYIFGIDPLEIAFDNPSLINSIGLGNCSLKTITIEVRTAVEIFWRGGWADTITPKQLNGGNAGTIYWKLYDNDELKKITIDYDKEGLYLLEKKYRCVSFEITAPKGTKIGRLAAGIAINIPTAVKKEPGFHSTAEPRRTLSGQIIHGAGGYFYRTVSLDSRYKIGSEIIQEIIAGFDTIGAGYPFFINLADESYKLPFCMLYATEKSQRQMGFESGVNRFLYSKRWEFEEAF